jgi:hypothetical protein
MWRRRFQTAVTSRYTSIGLVALAVITKLAGDKWG